MSSVRVQKTLEELRQILATAKTIAVVGLSDKPDRPSYGIAAYLQEVGYRIIPVNPTISEVLGEKAYPSLRDIPEAVDIVDIFRRAEFVPPVIDDAIAIGAKVVWMQLGIVNEEAALRAEAAGLTVVMDTCLGATHRNLRAIGKI
jgi:predicted CoA-binding protein